MEQLPVIQPLNNQPAVSGNYSQQQQQQQQQWANSNIYSPTQPMISQSNPLPNQYYYQQQTSGSVPLKSFPPQPPNPVTSNCPPAYVHNTNHNDLNNQISNLSLNGENVNGNVNVSNKTSTLYQPVQNYSGNQNSFQNLPNSTSQTHPPTSQLNYPGSQQQSQASIPNINSQIQANYNFNPPSQNSTENWNQNAYSNLKENQPYPVANNYNTYDQQQNGRMQNYQQQPPPASTGYVSYQHQQSSIPPPIGQNFGSNQQQMNRYPSSSGPGPTNFGGQYESTNQQNRLDPEGMPSVVQVILEDKTKFESSNNVLFTTTVPATVPPLVTTIMENDIQVVEDGGSARPNFLRPTIYQLPINEDNLKASDIPFGLVIKPFDDQEVEGKIVTFAIM